MPSKFACIFNKVSCLDKEDKNCIWVHHPFIAMIQENTPKSKLPIGISVPYPSPWHCSEKWMFNLQVWKKYKDELQKMTITVTCCPNLEDILIIAKLCNKKKSFIQCTVTNRNHFFFHRLQWRQTFIRKPVRENMPSHLSSFWKYTRPNDWHFSGRKGSDKYGKNTFLMMREL